MNSLKGVCRCCLSEGKFKSMEYAPPSPYRQSYSEMLNDILGYPLYNTGEARLICGTCSNKLYQAVVFRKQVQAAEKAFLACLQQKSEIKQECLDKSDIIMQTPQIKQECFDKADIIMIIPDKKIEIIMDSDSKDHLPKSNYPLLEKSETSLREHSLILQKLLQKADDTHNEFSSVHSAAEMKDIAFAEISVSLSEKEENVYCQKCEEHFPETSGYKRHVFACDRTCHNCKIKFKNLGTFRRHKVDVHREGFVCNVCDFVFAEEPRLLRHQRKIHMREKNVKCAHCDYEYFDKTGLARHLLVHYDNRPYSCRICKKKFKKGSTRNFHERIHTGDKRKVCQICGEKFVQRASLKYHLEKYHPGDAC